jgi:hypothetical protein
MGLNEIENTYGDRARNEGGGREKLNLQISNYFLRQQRTSKITKQF